MKPALTVFIITLAVAASGAYYMYSKTPEFVFAEVKRGCQKSDLKSFLHAGVAHYNDETRELTDKELNLMTEAFSKAANNKCPYRELLAKKATRTQLSADELKRLKVLDGYKYSFEGEDSKKALTIVKFNGQWRVLVVDANLATTTTVTAPTVAPGSTTTQSTMTTTVTTPQPGAVTPPPPIYHP